MPLLPLAAACACTPSLAVGYSRMLPLAAGYSRTLSPCMTENTRDLSDIVGGLHGGKYQFGAGGAQSFVGGQFAESLASSSSSSAADDDSKEWAMAGDLPRWARVLEPRTAQLAGTLAFAAAGDELEVCVQNTYKTWEPWIAAIVSEPATDLAFAICSPASGTLAPRGGASNVCDESKPYSDGAAVRVRCIDAAAGRPSHLVVKTEEEQWTFALCCAAPV